MPRWSQIKKRQETIAEHYNLRKSHPHAYQTAGPGLYLQEVPKGAMCKEVTGALKGQFRDQHLAAVYCSQLKIRIQHTGESLQEFAIAVKQLTHHAFPAQDDHVNVRAQKVFINS
jgi:hypothetical protein